MINLTFNLTVNLIHWQLTQGIPITLWERLNMREGTIKLDFKNEIHFAGFLLHGCNNSVDLIHGKWHRHKYHLLIDEIKTFYLLLDKKG